jgi:HEAT repeat protein
VSKTISPEDLAVFADRTADPILRERALSRLAHWEKGKYDHLEPEIAKLLDDPDPGIRGAALRTLLYAWQRAAYFDRAMKMLLSQPDPAYSVRSDAAFSLGGFAQLTGQRRDEAIRALVRALRSDEDWSVQAACYEALLELVAPDRSRHLPDEFDRDRDVDWALLAPYSTEEEHGP